MGDKQADKAIRAQGASSTSLQASQQAGFRFRIGADSVPRLGEEVDRQRGFTHLFTATRAPGGEVVRNSMRVLGAQHAEEIQFPQIF